MSIPTVASVKVLAHRSLPRNTDDLAIGSVKPKSMWWMCQINIVRFANEHSKALTWHFHQQWWKDRRVPYPYRFRDASKSAARCPMELRWEEQLWYSWSFEVFLFAFMKWDEVRCWYEKRRYGSSNFLSRAVYFMQRDWVRSFGRVITVDLDTDWVNGVAEHLHHM